MTRCKKVSARHIGNKVNARNIGIRQDLQVFNQSNVAAAVFRVPRMRNIKFIVKPAHKRMISVKASVREYAEKLFFQRIFRNPVVIIESCLRSPADVKRRVNIFFAPLKYFAELIPIINLFKFHMFNGCARYNESVIFFCADLVEGFIEFEHMLLGDVFGSVRFNLQKLNLNLKRRIAQKPEKLSFGFNLGGHQVKNKNIKRAYILRNSPFFGHNEYVF